MAFLRKCTLRPKPESAGEMIIFMFTANREAENTASHYRGSTTSEFPFLIKYLVNLKSKMKLQLHLPTIYHQFESILLVHLCLSGDCLSHTSYSHYS